MSAPLSTIPNEAAVVERPSMMLSRKFYLWLYEIWGRIKVCIALAGPVYAKTNQSASIVAATIYTVTQAGLYRVGYYARVTTIPTTSFSLTVAVSWRDGAVTKTQTFTAFTGAPGALASAFQSGEITVRADSGTLITMTVTYASVGATAMIFAIDAPVELVN